MHKTAIIGLDGAGWQHIRQCAKQWNLKFLNKIIQKGATGPMKSTIPPGSCPAWASFGTGKNPGKIGVFSFLDKKPKSYDMQLNYDVLNHLYCFWDALGDAGQTVMLLNMPLYGKKHVMSGDFIAGDFLPKIVYYPEELAKELELDKKMMFAEWPNGVKYEQIIKDCFKMLDDRLDVADKIFKKEWDVFILVLQLDTLEHFSWDKPENIRKYLERVDQWLEQHISDDINLIILGDHGSGELKGDFLINNWLANKNYLVFKKNPKQAKVLNKDRIEIILSKLGLVKFVMKIVPKRIIQMWPAKSLSFEKIKNQIDWSKTKAFACGDAYTGSVYINKKGREPEGIVNEKEYSLLIKEIIQELKKTKGPNGEKLDFDIHIPSTTYSGKYAENAPDIIFIINNLEYTTKFAYKPGNELFVSTRKKADHRPFGMLAAIGPDVKAGEIKNAEIIDIAPTILKHYKMPIDQEVDGKALDLFKIS